MLLLISSVLVLCFQKKKAMCGFQLTSAYKFMTLYLKWSLPVCLANSPQIPFQTFPLCRWLQSTGKTEILMQDIFHLLLTQQTSLAVTAINPSPSLSPVPSTCPLKPISFSLLIPALSSTNIFSRFLSARLPSKKSKPTKFHTNKFFSSYHFFLPFQVS